MEIIIGAVIAVVVAGIVILAYGKGVRAGIRMAKGEPPEKVKMPEVKLKKKEETDGLSFEDQFEALKGFEPKYTEEQNG